MDTKADQLARQLLANVRGALTAAANRFIEQNAEVKAFIERKVQRAAELVVEYAEAGDTDRPEIQKYMAIVNQSIVNETLAVLLNAEESVKDTILSVLKSVFMFALENLPTILALIPK